MHPPLLSNHPALTEEWDAERNTLPQYGSTTKAWWTCPQGHSYEAPIRRRIAGSGCPYCSGNKVLAGYNDILTKVPQTAKYWIDSTPAHEVYQNAKRKVQLKCARCKKPWSTSPLYLTPQSSFLCTDCRTIPQQTVATSPLSDEWSDPTPSHTVSIHSEQKYLWSCNHGHRYQASPKNRIHGRGCPYCAGKTLPGYNDLLSKVPEVATYWADDKDPSTLSKNSAYMATWKCPEHDYTWTAPVRQVVQRNTIQCPIDSGKVVIPGINDLMTTHPELVSQWSSSNASMNTYSAGSRERVEWICEHGHRWILRIADRTRYRNGYPSCPQCAVSSFHMEVSDFLKNDLGLSIEENNRSIISPYELDIVIPDHKLAIEINGVYWHSEATGKDRYYHYDKSRSAQAAGYRLIHLWEDDWSSQRDVAKSLLRHAVGQNLMKIGARQTRIQEIEHSVSAHFLDEHHIQGAVRASVHYGLFSEDDGLVAVCSWTKRPEYWELVRYASSVQVMGGMSKMVHYFERTHCRTGDQLVTFADVQTFSGDSYPKVGFVVDAELPPDYSYLVNGRREHKFNYRLKRFRDDPELKFEEGLTERQLAELNKIHRVWDAGKIKYRKIV